MRNIKDFAPVALAALALAFSTGLCAPPWSLQSKAAALADSNALEDRVSKRLDALDASVAKLTENLYILMGAQGVKPKR